MKAIITPAKAMGAISSIASKSVAHRLLICAALSDRKTIIRCANINKDILATVDCLKAMGADICYKDSCFHVTPIGTKANSKFLLCNESGSTLRFIIPIASALGGEWNFIMEGRLHERPLSPLKEELEAHGISFNYPASNNLCVSGKLGCGEYSISGNVSSQFISGLLFALSIIEGKSLLHIIGEIESAPYIEMTVDALEKFGAEIIRNNNKFMVIGKKLHSPQKLEVENDWSNAAFPLCAAALSGGSVTLNSVNFSSHQGDIKILDLLNAFGAKVTKKETSVTITGKKLRGIEINAEQIPDLVPVLATVAAGAEGTTKIYGASRLRIKESDRLASTYEMLTRLGADVTLTDDGFIINGKERLSGGTVDSYNDHRIAMSAAVASTICENKVTVIGAQAISKSYPDYWKDVSKLGLDIELQD